MGCAGQICGAGVRCRPGGLCGLPLAARCNRAPAPRQRTACAPSHCSCATWHICAPSQPAELAARPPPIRLSAQTRAYARRPRSRPRRAHSSLAARRRAARAGALQFLNTL